MGLRAIQNASLSVFFGGFFDTVITPYRWHFRCDGFKRLLIVAGGFWKFLIDSYRTWSFHQPQKYQKSLLFFNDASIFCEWRRFISSHKFQWPFSKKFSKSLNFESKKKISFFFKGNDRRSGRTFFQNWRLFSCWTKGKIIQFHRFLF